MKLFLVEYQDGQEKSIFARTEHKAVEQFVTWQMVNEVPAEGFSVLRVTIRSLEAVSATHLREALTLELEGIGKYDEAHGWTIKPISDERPIPD